jgi:ankyrin repeat protein
MCHAHPKDYKGITPLGYAIGANRIAVVKLLLDPNGELGSDFR